MFDLESVHQNSFDLGIRIRSVCSGNAVVIPPAAVILVQVGVIGEAPGIGGAPPGLLPAQVRVGAATLRHAVADPDRPIAHVGW